MIPRWILKKISNIRLIVTESIYQNGGLKRTQILSPFPRIAKYWNFKIVKRRVCVRGFQNGQLVRNRSRNGGDIQDLIFWLVQGYYSNLKMAVDQSFMFRLTRGFHWWNQKNTQFFMNMFLKFFSTDGAQNFKCLYLGQLLTDFHAIFTVKITALNANNCIIYRAHSMSTQPKISETRSL